MKRYKKILMIWICAIVVVAVSVIVALYDNANQGQDVAKEVAVETLRKVAERVVNREFDGLGMFYAFGSDSTGIRGVPCPEQICQLCDTAESS